VRPRVRIVFFFALFVALAAYGQSFYATHFQRGLTEYHRGQYAAAAQDLRIAAFGLVDDIPQYETAQIYALLAFRKLGRTADVANVADRILAAEKIQPSYRRLDLDPEVRTQFETILHEVVPSQRLAKVPTFSGGAVPPPMPAPAPRPVPAVPQPVLTTARPTLSLADRAAAAYASGDYAEAQQLANAAIGDDYVNAMAQTVLAKLGWRGGDWNGVVDHYSIVRTRRRLTNDENAQLYVAMVRSGKTNDAEGLRRMLPPAVLSTELVKSVTPPAQVAQQPAPAPQPQPAPQPVPQPVPQPAPQRAAKVVQQPQPKPQVAAGGETPPSQPARTPALQPNVSPLVAIAKRQPSEAAAVHDVAAALIEADRLLREGRIASAREAYLRLTLEPAVSRELSLEIAKGLNRTSAWHASSAQYQKLYPLKHGEEMHMLYEAENRYELSDLDGARRILAVASPYLPKSAEVELYRGKIQGAH